MSLNWTASPSAPSAANSFPSMPRKTVALRKELDEVFSLSCTYTYSTPGITNVTIR